jgi:16S rRNA (cytidine1402-2'-O)-methyltransferase
LREVKLIASEDTRKTKRLLAHYDINTPLTSYHEHNKQAKLAHLLNSLREKDVALVSEAGMPGMSDPGYELIVAAAEQAIPTVVVPGASVVVTALIASGLPTHQFIYLGFLPRKKGERRQLLASIATQPRTIIAFESPHRLLPSLRDVVETLGDRRIAVCREMTKLYEEVFRGRVSQAIEHFPQPRGEFTLVMEGKVGGDKPELTDEVMEELRHLRQQGLSAREAIAQVGKTTRLSRKELYRAWLRLP